MIIISVEKNICKILEGSQDFWNIQIFINMYINSTEELIFIICIIRKESL